MSIKCLAIIDTSVLLLIAYNKIPLENLLETLAECRKAVLSSTVEELKRIGLSKGEKASKANWVLNNIIKNFEIIEVESSGDADRDLLKYALEKSKELRIIIVTADFELKDAALRYGIEVAVPRISKNRFMIVSP